MSFFDFLKKQTPTLDPLAGLNSREGLPPIAELLQAISVPFQQFSQYKVNTATTEAYNQLELVYRCVNIISNQLSALDIKVYDKAGEEVPGHPIELLLWRPNKFMPPSDFKTLIWSHLELTGSAYLLYQDDSLLPLYPDKVEIIPSRVGGEYIAGYKYDNKENFTTDEVIHLKYIDPKDGLVGVPPLQSCYRHVDIAKAMDLWNYNSFKNRTVPDLALLLNNDTITETDLSAIKNSVARQSAGAANARKPMILPKIHKVEKLGMTAVEMDFIAGRKASQEAISVAFGVPLPMLGIYDNGTFSNVESANKDFWENTLLPKAYAFTNTLSWFFENQGILKPGEWVGFNKQGIKALQRNYTERVNDAINLGKFMVETGFDAEQTLEQLNKQFELGIDMSEVTYTEPDSIEFVPQPSNPDDEPV